MKLYSQATIRELKKKYGFNLTKSLGQNFLTDKNIIDKIVEASNITKEDTVVEIGPGIGVITSELAECAKKVIAIEIDKNLIPILGETLADFDNIEIINADILKTDLNAVTKGEKNVRIVGNLPYYITTPIIMKLLEEGVEAKSITVMMQKEVADRIKAEPGTKARGAISVAVQYYCEVHKVADVPKEVFVPMPKVDSTVLRLDIRKEKPVSLLDGKLFFAAIKSGFGQRRKTLLNSLSSGAGFEKDDIRKILSEAKIDPQRRAETLTIDEFAQIANAMYQHKRG